jgi:hypothetical protein
VEGVAQAQADADACHELAHARVCTPGLARGREHSHGAALAPA